MLWFDSEKGFGFVQTPGGGKVFLHARQLEAAGQSSVIEGMGMTVVVETGEKGPQIARVLEIDPASTVQTARHEAADETQGTVKFYNSDKGFGFIGLTDGGKDIFVHASTLSRSGISSLEEGQTVRVTYAQGTKGPEARSIWLA